MKARDARCPRCGACFRDVEPYLGLDDKDAFAPIAAQSISGVCSNGHRFCAEWERGKEVTFIPLRHRGMGHNCAICGTAVLDGERLRSGNPVNPSGYPFAHAWCVGPLNLLGVQRHAEVESR